MKPKAKISSKMEDYLTTIHGLCREEGVARVKGIAERLEVSNASVVGALKNLKRRELVLQEPYGYIRLTERGEQIASSVIQRHQVLTHFFENVLHLDPETSEIDACRIEHEVSPQTVKRLRALADFIEKRPKSNMAWHKEFPRFCSEWESGEQQ